MLFISQRFSSLLLSLLFFYRQGSCHKGCNTIKDRLHSIRSSFHGSLFLPFHVHHHSFLLMDTQSINSMQYNNRTFPPHPSHVHDKPVSSESSSDLVNNRPQEVRVVYLCPLVLFLFCRLVRLHLHIIQDTQVGLRVLHAPIDRFSIWLLCLSVFVDKG